MTTKNPAASAGGCGKEDDSPLNEASQGHLEATDAERELREQREEFSQAEAEAERNARAAGRDYAKEFGKGLIQGAGRQFYEFVSEMIKGGGS